MSWVVSGAAAVVKVAGVSRYLDRGATVPEEADSDSVEHLAAVGLISETIDPEPKSEPETESKPEPEPDAEPAPAKSTRTKR